MIEMREYLKSRGFTGHPFNTFDADREKNLSKFVVLPPYFESVFGMPEDPQPFLVLGMRGLGKTTLKRMLNERIKERYKNKILPIDYSFFPFTKKKELNEVTLLDHMLELVKHYVKTICSLIDTDSTLKAKLSNDQKQSLFHLCEIYLKEEEKQLYYPKIMSFVEKMLKTYPKKKGREFYLSPSTDTLEVIDKSDFTLNKIQEILQTFGYVSSYIFIDKLDETSRTMKEPEQAGILVGPLISCLEIVQRDFFSFKFFVPAESIPNLKKCGFRNDKIQNQVITWSDEKLHEVLRKRIMAFNKDGKLLGKLGPLCDDTISEKVDEFVIKKSLNSPRNLLRFCNAMFSEHIEISKDLDELISKRTVAVALKKYEYSLKIDQFCAYE